ncbi:hypothetical protein [Paenibacillus alvei]|uniref:Uncharacterized protein n=1 Tax=Paenibacillus alvei TaxID=44250 RepID=A0AAP7DKH0_PAEAL|nr:hypothetical protein [Paenibacillus alvei]NOJ73898.1 hypothetical protein [Paenibacillus alvei]
MSFRIRVPRPHFPDFPDFPDIPDFDIPNPFEALTDGLKKEYEKISNELAAQYQGEHPNGDFDDCVVIVAAGCAAAGAAAGGPLGAAVGAAGGVPAARIACRRIFPE